MVVSTARGRRLNRENMFSLPRLRLLRICHPLEAKNKYLNIASLVYDNNVIIIVDLDSATGE